ncbi:hypothetical protein AB0D04_04700 [Streptomyces sp. NPDC048483]|uniref:hypothetical protein n=1 Tax=Streptomyces sp. NPDC048483 TaxID=3154927 RepID=UPI0034240BAB
MLDELPEGLDRTTVEELMAATRPAHIHRIDIGPEVSALRDRLARTFPHPVELPRDAAWAFQCAVNCRVGLRRTVARLTPKEETAGGEEVA